MKKKVLILGDHPVREDIVRQFGKMGLEVDCRTEMKVSDVCCNDYDELCLLTSIKEKEMCNLSVADQDAIALLGQLASEYDIERHNRKRMTCHLLVQESKTLQMLQTCDPCDELKRKMDIYPFTMDEVWSRSLLLDYEPITVQSEKHVHLVIFGMDAIGEMVALQAAHVCHYPNYIRNHSLRTRITMIDRQAELKSESFIKRYQHLFDNSYYRLVKPSEEKAVTKFHKPMYEGEREDFVDVEWEFVQAETWQMEIREKLVFWAEDDKQLLTIVLADKESNNNTAQALYLPNKLYEQHIPVYTYCEQHKGYDVTLPLVRMAKNVNYIYNQCYNDNVKDWNGSLRYAVEIDSVEREQLWAELSNVKRMSNLYNAMTIPTKMRSIGLDANDWAKFYDITQQEIELLAQVEHNRWSVEELILGFRPCTDDEQKKIAADVTAQKDIYKARKTHYDLRAYKDLRPDKTGRSVQVYDICLSACLPLIAKSFADEGGGEA